jgi:hypothetical protein
MKIGDMVKQQFTDTVVRYGIIVGEMPDVHFLEPGTVFKVKYLPHPDVPFRGNDMYWEACHERILTVVSSVS